MSGIYGYIVRRQPNEDACIHALDLFNRPYGEDGNGMYAAGKMGIGCRQEHFSAVFPASAPVLRDDQTVSVVDALIFNRDELLQELDVPADISDEELLLNLVRIQGFDALKKVNGDFAGAIYNQTDGSWTLFRDHSGVRPLFYYLDNEIFAFSTDMRGLTAFPGADCAINEKKLYEKLAGYNDLSLCETEYRNIRCIRPAAWTQVCETEDGFSVQEHIYWKWRQKKVRMKSDQDYQQELRRLITDAVKCRLDAIPGLVGCELSGGLDSSVIAMLISRLGREGRFFSWSFDPAKHPFSDTRDERKIIQDVCVQEGISCKYKEIVEREPITDLLNQMVVPYANTRALGEGSAYVRGKGARVMFTGHGGDEGVSHRCNQFELWTHHEYAAFFRNLYCGTRNKKLRLLRTVKAVLNQLFRVNRHFKKPYFRAYGNCSRFLKASFKDRMQQGFVPQKHYFAYRPDLYILQGGHRVRLDNAAFQGAENGVRYLFPFIDYRVLDYALSIPRAQYHNGYTNRYIYRAAFDDMLPQSLRDMHYKDTPSMNNYQPEGDPRSYFYETKSGLLDCLDRKYWEPYLDFDALDKVDLPENYTRRDFENISFWVSDILACCFIQQLPIKTREWCETHE